MFPEQVTEPEGREILQQQNEKNNVYCFSPSFAYCSVVVLLWMDYGQEKKEVADDYYC